jgi:hypothetical protein
MNQFAKYIEETLHIKPEIGKYAALNELPLYLRNSYNLCIIKIQDITFLLAYPKEQTNLTANRKQVNQLKKLTGLDCVLCLDDVRAYTKEKMLSEAIPFIILGKQIYLPFLGVALSQKNSREIPFVEKLSFSSQKLLLTAIYHNWTQTTLKEAADALGLSKMSISRCFDELHSVGLDFTRTIGKTRCFIWSGNRRELWDAVLPFLRNPIKRQYRLGEVTEVSNAKLGGISALCHYSMLADNPYTVYAITANTDKLLKSTKLIIIPDSESPAMVIQVMHYDLVYKDAHVIDPLTAVLCVADGDKSDPRVEAAIEEILEEYLDD